MTNCEATQYVAETKSQVSKAGRQTRVPLGTSLSQVSLCCDSASRRGGEKLFSFSASQETVCFVGLAAAEEGARGSGGTKSSGGQGVGCPTKDTGGRLVFHSHCSAITRASWTTADLQRNSKSATTRRRCKVGLNSALGREQFS